MHATRLRDWSLYNAFKTLGQQHAPALLNGIVEQAVLPPRPPGPGRPVTQDQERRLLYWSALRTFLNDSSRDAIGQIPWLRDGAPGHALPHFNTLTDFLRRPRTTLLIQAALEESTRPVWGLESVFATDATGIGIPYAPRWHELRALKKTSRKDYAKLHMVCGACSNVVVAATVTHGRRHDSPVFRTLAPQVGRHFLVDEVSGDSAYACRANCETVADLGGTPYFWPSRDATPRAGGVAAWRTMILLFQEARVEFEVCYHQRSNAETVFAVLKALFGGFVRAKDEVARFNEVLLKVLCYNVVALLRSAMELGVDLSVIEAARSHEAAYPLEARGAWTRPGYAPGHCIEVQGSP